jgi:hypothetical protein
MPGKWIDLLPDHPIFTRGVSFVFRCDSPEEQERQDDSEHDDEDDE